MGKIERFDDLEVWQKSRKLAQEIYLKTLEGSFAKDFSLRDQINRSSGSVMDNIAEGFEREGRKEFIQYLSIAKASSAEVRSQLFRAKDRNHITEIEFKALMDQANTVGRMLGGFMNYLKKSNIQGLKYKIEEPENIY